MSEQLVFQGLCIYVVSLRSYDVTKTCQNMSAVLIFYFFAPYHVLSYSRWVEASMLWSDLPENSNSHINECCNF